YRKAIDLREAILRVGASDPGLRHDQAITHFNLGKLFNDSRRVDEAIPEFGDAWNELDRLSNEFPANAEYRSDLAAAGSSLAALLDSSGGGAEAEPIFRRSLDLLEALSKDFPQTPSYKKDLAITAYGMGRLFLGRHQWSEALPFLENAVRIQTDLLALDSGS